MTYSLHGKGVSRGIALGTAHIVQRDTLELIEYQIPEQEVEAEVSRLTGAIDDARRNLRTMRDRIPPQTPADIAALMLCSSSHSQPSSPMRCLQRTRLDGSQGSSYRK